jgi:hypothetical protein
MRLTVLALPLFLAGCVIFPSPDTYEPLTAEVTDAAQYEVDLASCHAVAHNYKPGLNGGAVARAAISGAANNTAYAVLPPIGLVPLAGAAGGAVGASFTGLGINGEKTIKVLVKCLEERTRRDKSAIVVDPND